jgi:hypothetical protein
VLDPAVLERLKLVPKGPNGLRDYLLGEWSDPSPVVGVPLDGRVRLAGATAGDDAKASFLVDGFGRAPDTGVWVQASKLKDFSRGGIVNFVEDAEYLIDTRTHIDEYDSFKFHTGITVLDVRGGEKLSRDLQAPSRVMLMGPSGELKIRRELDDAPEVESHKAMFAKPKPGEGR